MEKRRCDDFLKAKCQKKELLKETEAKFQGVELQNQISFYVVFDIYNIFKQDITITGCAIR